MPSELPAPPQIFDRDRIAKRLRSADLNEPDFITQLVIDDLRDRLAPITRNFQKALIIGPIPSMLPTHLTTAEAEVRLEVASTLINRPNTPLLDPERLEFSDKDYDLIVSIMDLQFVNDVPGYLTRIRHHLKPDGLMIAAALGGRSLSELRQVFLEADTTRFGGAFARIAPFMDVRDAGGLLQRAGFALPVTDLETHRVRYADPLALIAEIRALGASNPMREQPSKLMTRNLLMDAAGIYQSKFADPDGRIPATVEILWMSGWAPDESQQKPLRPGSAKTRLADVLKDKS